MLAASIVGAAAWFTAQAGYECPSSSAFLYASCQTTASAASNCDAVRYEMLARINGQYAQWHDPHNNGTYSIIKDQPGSTLELQRRTGDNKYTDKINFAFEDKDGSCIVRGCSRSQTTSVADFSTNYCNMYSLYCSSADGCEHVENDIQVTETEVKPSAGASKSKKDCLKV